MDRTPSALVRSLRAAGTFLQRAPRAAALVAALAWMGAIRALSSLPGDSLGLAPALGYVFNLGHAVLYGVLAACWILCLPRERGWPRLGARESLGVFAATLCFALLDERLQGAVPGRTVSAWDLWTDAVGAAAMLWVVRHVGSERAGDAGLVARVAVGLAACAAAAALATWPPVA
ncbi:MAG TPA: VanZ family protein [Planctomycetota bacterium]|nr:VanZ family protein [Planctomycetota bacterium]